MSAKEMAQSLGIDVKKLRDIEKGKNFPDSELLCRLYELYNIPPTVILKNNKCMANEIATLLDMMDIENRRVILNFIKKAHKNYQNKLH